MQPGTKVIYFKSYDGQPAPARIGYIIDPASSPGWMILTAAPDELVTIGMW